MGGSKDKEKSAHLTELRTRFSFFIFLWNDKLSTALQMYDLLAQFGIVFSCCEHVCCRRFCQVHCPLSAAFVCLFLFLLHGASFPFLLALAHHVKRTCCVPPLLCSDLCRGQAFLSIGVAFALCCLGTLFRKSVCLSRLFTKSKFFYSLERFDPGPK